MTPIRAAILTLGLVAIAASGVEAQTRKEIVPITGANNPTLSAVVKVGDMLYLSGQLGFVPGAGLAPGGIAAETTQTLENIKRILTEAGSSMERVVKCTVFLADIADFREMNTVYRTFFPSDPPARSTVAVGALVANGKIEIECMALAGS